MTTLHLIAHLMSQGPQVSAYWHYLTVLQHAPNTCGAVDTSNHVIYGGSCFQSFMVALHTHTSLVWDILGG